MRLLFCRSLIVVLIIFIAGCENKVKSPADYVNPFIGTDAGGHTFPGACLPFGMVQLSPDNGYKGVKAYGYNGKNIIGFSHTHLSGTGPFTKTHYNNVLIMPTIGELKVKPGIAKELDFLSNKRLTEILETMSDKEKQEWEKFTDKEKDEKKLSIFNREKLEIFDNKDREEEGYFTDDSFKGYESYYSHQEEDASPGYYTVILKDYDIKAELTATERAGFHKYTFPETDEAHIVIDVTHSLTPGRDTYVKIISDKEIEGYVTGDMETSYDLPLTCYFYAEFNKPFKSVGTWNGENIYPGQKEISGNEGAGAFVDFSTTEGEKSTKAPAPSLPEISFCPG
jgi:putative alpha-1,2-mannosidase